MKVKTIGKRDVVRVTAYLPVETAQIMERLKENLGVPYSKIVEKALKQYLEKQEQVIAKA